MRYGRRGEAEAARKGMEKSQTSADSVGLYLKSPMGFGEKIP